MNQLEKSTSDLKLYLKRAGFEVWTLGGGSEAYVRKLKNNNYIILCDSEGLSLPTSNDILIGVAPQIGELEDISYHTKSITNLKRILPIIISTLECVPAKSRKQYQSAIKDLKNKVLNNHIAR